MTLVIAAHERSPQQLLDLIDEAVPHGWHLSITRQPWGSLATAGDSAERVGHWLVVGMPSADPWGRPGYRIAPDRVAALLRRYGLPAVQMLPGPWFAVDLRSGAVLRALNGIVPISATTAGPFAAGTPPGLICRLGGAAAMAPATLAAPGGPQDIVDDELVRERVPLSTWASIDREITRRTAGLVLSGPVDASLLPGVRQDRATNELVFLPRFDRLPQGSAVDRPTWVQETASQLWWRARLAGSWLHAPVLERPARDLMAMCLGSP
ncbi:MAG: hypothetical protein IPM45_14440 [Acidimicrobiales bacterium]|nr:hypothetical protein [Acidimicrobiales bacterium]